MTTRFNFLKHAVLGFILISNPAIADDTKTIKPNDFAYGMDLTVSTGGPVYQVELPEEIYRGIKWGNLRDLRVFNGQDEVIASTLEHPVFEAHQNSATHPITIFMIEGAAAGDNGANSIEVKEDASGKVAAVRFVRKGAQVKAEPLTAYLLDLRKQNMMKFY